MSGRLLVAGERVRLVPGGDLYEVKRVSPCAAYIFKVFDPPKVEHFTRPNGTVHEIRVSRGRVEPGIAPTSFVYRDSK